MRLRAANQSTAMSERLVSVVMIWIFALALTSSVSKCNDKIKRFSSRVTEREVLALQQSNIVDAVSTDINQRLSTKRNQAEKYLEKMSSSELLKVKVPETSSLKGFNSSFSIRKDNSILANKSLDKNHPKQQTTKVDTTRMNTFKASSSSDVINNNRTKVSTSTKAPKVSSPPNLIETSQQQFTSSNSISNESKQPLNWLLEEGTEFVQPASTSTGSNVSGCLGHFEGTSLWVCQGVDLIRVPLDLVPHPTSLQLSNTGIERLTRNSLVKYKDTLRDFSIENALKLVSIEPATFEALIKLRVVYIFSAPKLVSFDLAVSGIHPDLTVIRIQRSSLRYWPDLTQFHQERILTSIDLDNNKIHSLRATPINVRVELLNLEFNRISSIDEFTFNGSEIGVLSLKGNRFLTNIHPNAFANLRNLVKLDLSGTSIQQLPTEGIHQLRSLIVEDTYTLKRIPSIYEFPMLEEAHLTYAYHCCSFRYPKTHDPNAHSEHLHLQEEIDALCVANQRNNHNHNNANQIHSSSTTQSSIQSPTSQPLVTSTGNTPQRQPLDTQKAGDADFEGTFDERAPPPPTTPVAENVEYIVDFPDRASYFESIASKTTNESNISQATNHFERNQKAGLRRLWLSAQNIDCGELAFKHSAFQNISCSPEPDDFNPCEDIMGYPVLRVAVWFVVGASVFGNLSVIVVLGAVFRRLSVPKFLQLNLALGDLVMGFYLATLAFADLTTKGTYFNYAIDWQHGFGCKIAGAASLFASQLSIFTLSVITFERYYTITYSIDLNMRGMNDME